jgi:hypothetical protein
MSDLDVGLEFSTLLFTDNIHFKLACRNCNKKYKFELETQYQKMGLLFRKLTDKTGQIAVQNLFIYLPHNITPGLRERDEINRINHNKNFNTY